MHLESIPFEKVNAISKRDLAYIQKDPNLEPFIANWPNLENFSEAIVKRAAFETDRNLLVNVLQSQYNPKTANTPVSKNIETLASPQCFCVVTAHQPCLLTGPLYYIYKICSTINLARQLVRTYPEYAFVPIFICGGEDHDFEEINHLHLFGRKFEWQREVKGPVGRLNLEGLESIIEEILQVLDNNAQTPDIRNLLKEELNSSENYGQFLMKFTQALFEEFGLVCLNMDDPKLKEKFKPIIADELLTQRSFDLVSQTIQKMSDMDMKVQAPPREINLFYIENGTRERIVQNGDYWEILGSGLKWSTSELQSIVESQPEKFSPNVILRPLYQELILPNLAYVGGGGELAYWTERQSLFEAYGIPFPLLVRRNSVLYVDHSNQKQLNKLGISHFDIFRDTHELINSFVEENSDHTLDINKEKEVVSEIFDKLARKARKIEQPLEKYVLAESAKQLKVLDHIENKLLKAEKQKFETGINRIEKLKEKLFPQQGLQERYDNFLSIYTRHGQQFLKYLVENLDPLKSDFLIILE